MKRTYYYARSDCWWGAVCAIPCGPDGDERARHPFTCWRRVSREEYRDLKREGFRVRTNKRPRAKAGGDAR